MHITITKRMLDKMAPHEREMFGYEDEGRSRYVSYDTSTVALTDVPVEQIEGMRTVLHGLMDSRMRNI